MVTSANLSKQAWGAIANKDGEVRIQSYEVGVVVWPALFADVDEKDARKEEVSMVPVFGRDIPAHSDVCDAGDVVEKVETDDEETEDEDELVNEEETDDETEDEAPLSLPLLPSLPQQPKRSSGNATKPSARHSNRIQRKKVVGFRMPYDLPLSPYAPGEEPWCASMPCAVRDWMGRGWSG
jgi:tyrosyl-DNA phosphodiesterase-1